jgi:hypothetical protein
MKLILRFDGSEMSYTSPAKTKRTILVKLLPPPPQILNYVQQLWLCYWYYLSGFNIINSSKLQRPEAYKLQCDA